MSRLRDSDRARELVARLKARRESAKVDVVADLTAEWFPEEAAFFNDPALLTAAQCGRRAGKTRGIVRDHLRDLLTITGYRGLYLNSTRGEAERLAWIGGRQDGFRSLVERLKLPLRLDNTDLTIHNPATDGWMELRGADDETELRKRLGTPYHKVTWDEWQKIPPKLALSIREVFFPSLLDFGGKFRGTGTPSRQMTGLAWDVTRPENDKRTKGWSVHRWTLLDNPFFGRARGAYVVWGARDEVVSGPHEPGEMAAAIAGARWLKGVLALQHLYGGPEVADIDSPIMQREAFGRWVREDAAYVYHVHKVPRERLFYAPHRTRDDGFVDIPAALKDLPWNWREAFFSFGNDIGYSPDPFGIVLWAWHPQDRTLREVASWKKTELTSDDQIAVIRSVREHVALGIIVADAGGPAKPTVKGWSKEFVERYGIPILEAEKAHKVTAIELFNTDLVTGGIQLREDSPLYEEMAELQWATIVSASGRQVEDPTLANHCCDAGLYAHRHSYQYRARPEDAKLQPGSTEWTLREERALEDASEDGDEATYH